MRQGEETKSAVNAVSKSEAELKSLLRGSGSKSKKTTALVKRKLNVKNSLQFIYFLTFSFSFFA